MASNLLLPRKQMDNKTVLDSIKRNIVHRVSALCRTLYFYFLMMEHRRKDLNARIDIFDAMGN